MTADPIYPGTDLEPAAEATVYQFRPRDTIDLPLDDPSIVVDDAERENVEPGSWGGPVDSDSPDPVTIYGTITRFGTQERPPIIPAWMRNSQQRRAFARETRRFIGYYIGFHTFKSPRYLGRVLLYAPVGLWLFFYRQLRWAAHPEYSALVNISINKKDAAIGLQAQQRRDKKSGPRFLLLGFEAVALIVLGFMLALAATTLVQVIAALIAAPLLAKLGTPADKPLLDRVYEGPKFTRLHAAMVRTALCSIGIAGLKDPASITFPQDIHRDGPGWLARVNLPQGVEAVKVLESRGALSSALRLPVDQVWPAYGPDHAGQVDLWVGYLPASKMGQPSWSLAAKGARTSVFAEHEFGTDQRQRPVKTSLFARNFLIGGVPGSGKSYGARALATIALLDPTCELIIAEFKGTGDFADMAHLCSSYVCGVDDQSLEEGGKIIKWGLAEAERRGERIRRFKAKGLAPEGKVTPELAAMPGSGLHPICIVIDEAHELFLYDKDIAAAAERLIKRGRALGIIIILATQIPDSKSVPANITRCVTVRWCLAVQDQIANDMILGTGAYKRGMSAAVYRPGVDAGWGIAIGLEQSGPARSHFPTPEVNRAIIERATALRGGVIGSEDEVKTVHRDLLADVREVFQRTGAKRLFRQALLDNLIGFWPEAYLGWTADMLGEALRKAGVPVVDVKVLGTVAKGVKVEDVARAIGSRAASTEVAARK